MTDKEKAVDGLSRRAMVQGLSGTLASIALFERAHGLESSERAHKYDFRKQRDSEEAVPYPNAHGGKGVIDVTYFFREDGTETTAAVAESGPPNPRGFGVFLDRSRTGRMLRKSNA